MVSKARLDLPEPDSPVITISALRGILRCRSLRLCSRAPETTISPCDLTASSLRGRLAGAATGPATSGRRLPAGAGGGRRPAPPAPRLPGRPLMGRLGGGLRLPRHPLRRCPPAGGPRRFVV